MSRTLLHDWECSIEKNKNNTEELLRIAEDIYNTAYARGKASEERPQGEWIRVDKDKVKCNKCEVIHYIAQYPSSAKIDYCPNCGCDMRKPNCVRCDHFGKCDGCEKGDEE